LVAAIGGIENVATAQKKVTVELWNWLPEYERQFWNKAAEQFNKLQKDGVIEMKYQEVACLDLPVKFYQNLSSQPDASPDILSIEFNQWPTYSSEKARGLSDLTSLTNKPNAPFSAAFQEEYTFGGKKYAVSLKTRASEFQRLLDTYISQKDETFEIQMNELHQ
jgi:ABC-type glycerol-3-phosphate transport system substrate-binding protein